MQPVSFSKQEGMRKKWKRKDEFMTFLFLNTHNLIIQKLTLIERM